MPLVNMRDIVYHAYNNNYAVGAFDLVSLDFLEAVIGAAEDCRSSVILSIAEPHEELYSTGVLTYCLTLDPNADDYVKRIFGTNNYTIIDHVDKLPEQLPTLFASLTA